jgi:hypothetical protein
MFFLFQVAEIKDESEDEAAQDVAEDLGREELKEM